MGSMQHHDAPHVVLTELRKAQFAVDKDKESVDIGEEGNKSQYIRYLNLLRPRETPLDFA
jgi:hypothetical protein